MPFPGCMDQELPNTSPGTKHEAVTRGREKRSLRAHLNVDIYRLALLAAEAGTRQHIAQLMFWRQASKFLQ